jgi:hypothetical protein
LHGQLLQIGRLRSGASAAAQGSSGRCGNHSFFRMIIEDPGMSEPHCKAIWPARPDGQWCGKPKAWMTEIDPDTLRGCFTLTESDVEQITLVAFWRIRENALEMHYCGD